MILIEDQRVWSFLDCVYKSYWMHLIAAKAVGFDCVLRLRSMRGRLLRMSKVLAEVLVKGGYGLVAVYTLFDILREKGTRFEGFCPKKFSYPAI